MEVVLLASTKNPRSLQVYFPPTQRHKYPIMLNTERRVNRRSAVAKFKIPRINYYPSSFQEKFDFDVFWNALRHTQMFKCVTDVKSVNLIPKIKL